MKKFTLFIFILFNSLLVFGQSDSLWVINPLIEKLNTGELKIGKLQQIVVAFKLNQKDKDYKVMGLEKAKGKWKLAIAPVKASIGRNGFAKENEKMDILNTITKSNCEIAKYIYSNDSIDKSSSELLLKIVSSNDAIIDFLINKNT